VLKGGADMNTGERIKKRRKELGLTQEELARRMGNTSRASVSIIESNRDDLTTARVRKIAEALETTPAYIMGWDETIELSDDERILIECYRSADIDLQNTVRRLLAYAEKFKEINNG
jgi:transcriptional regulator with XRE-family HTH domain